MGWTFMRKPEKPRQYLDEQFTWTCDDGTKNRVLRSAFAGRTEYYAAVETIKPDGERSVWAAVCMVKFVPKARDGYTFGYKDMSESMGPYAWRCPKTVMALLTAPSNEYAAQWREKCRTWQERKHAIAALKTGDKLRMIDCRATLNGHAIDEIEAYRGERRRLYFRHPVMGLFRFPGINDYQWEKM